MGVETQLDFGPQAYSPTVEWPCGTLLVKTPTKASIFRACPSARVQCRYLRSCGTLPTSTPAQLFMLQKSWDSGILTLPQRGKEEELQASVQFCMGHLSSEMGLSCHFRVPLAFHPSPWCDLPTPKPQSL